MKRWQLPLQPCYAKRGHGLVGEEMMGKQLGERKAEPGRLRSSSTHATGKKGWKEGWLLASRALFLHLNEHRGQKFAPTTQVTRPKPAAETHHCAFPRLRVRSKHTGIARARLGKINKACVGLTRERAKGNSCLILLFQAHQVPASPVSGGTKRVFRRITVS